MSLKQLESDSIRVPFSPRVACVRRRLNNISSSRVHDFDTETVSAVHVGIEMNPDRSDIVEGYESRRRPYREKTLGYNIYEFILLSFKRHKSVVGSLR